MKRAKQRLDALEKVSSDQRQQITRIEIVDGETGEVGAVIHVGGTPDGADALQTLKYKHETDPPRKLHTRQA